MEKREKIGSSDRLNVESLPESWNVFIHSPCLRLFRLLLLRFFSKEKSNEFHGWHHPILTISTWKKRKKKIKTNRIGVYVLRGAKVHTWPNPSLSYRERKSRNEMAETHDPFLLFTTSTSHFSFSSSADHKPPASLTQSTCTGRIQHLSSSVVHVDTHVKIKGRWRRRKEKG